MAHPFLVRVYHKRGVLSETFFALLYIKNEHFVMKILILELNSFTLTNVHKNLPAIGGVGEVGRDGTDMATPHGL